MSVFRENIEHIVKIELTDDEKLAACTEMTQAYGEKQRLEVRKKAEVDHFKNLIEGEEARIRRNGELILKGYREQVLDCESVKNYGDNTVTIYRLDNGALVSSRELTEDEQQTEMPLDEDVAGNVPDQEDPGQDTPVDVPDPPEADETTVVEAVE